MKVPAGEPAEGTKVTGQDVTITPHGTTEHSVVWTDANDRPSIPKEGTLPALGLGLLAVAFFAAGIVLLVMAYYSTWMFWPRVGLAALGTWCLACAISVIATQSGEISHRRLGHV